MIWPNLLHPPVKVDFTQLFFELEYSVPGSFVTARNTIARVFPPEIDIIGALNNIAGTSFKVFNFNTNSFEFGSDNPNIIVGDEFVGPEGKLVVQAEFLFFDPDSVYIDNAQNQLGTIKPCYGTKRRFSSNRKRSWW